MSAESTGQPQYGIRVSVSDSDPFARLVDDGWSTTHWYSSRTERDLALAEMSREHEYSRQGDKPTLIYKPVERESTRN